MAIVIMATSQKTQNNQAIQSNQINRVTLIVFIFGVSNFDIANVLRTFTAHVKLPRLCVCVGERVRAHVPGRHGLRGSPVRRRRKGERGGKGSGRGVKWEKGKRKDVEEGDAGMGGWE